MAGGWRRLDRTQPEPQVSALCPQLTLQGWGPAPPPWAAAASHPSTTGLHPHRTLRGNEPSKAASSDGSGTVRRPSERR